MDKALSSAGNIEVVIDSRGKVTLRVSGVKGTECVKLTRDLEESLGVVVSRELTSEYYEAQVQRTVSTQESRRGG